MGNSQSQKVSEHDQAILNLKLQRDRVRKYQKQVVTVLDREKQLAQECLLKNDKPRALLALRHKKYQEHLLKQTDEHLENLEKLTREIEFAQVQTDVLKGLQEGNEALKKLNSEMSLDKVEKIVGESIEAREYQEEVSRMLAEAGMSAEDEEDVERELEEMERLAHPEPAVPELPNVPQKQPEAPAEQKEEEEPERRQAVPA
ncbi:vacuolar protein sorting-associated protein 20 [Trichomonascus vanleenenianus]|uniref:ESCRT-III subunit protein VPS20 n=1 Tax=Trichomonascus vanleenenianus TaxID=2268995 RepID=UPI003ECA5D6A